MSDPVSTFQDEAYADLLKQGYETNDLLSSNGIINTPPSSVTDAKQHQQISAAYNGFESDNDDHDETELRAVQRKYHDQLDLNTSLMQEVEKITKENNQHLTELKDKERTLQTVMHTLDEVRRQNVRHAESQENFQSMQSQQRRAEQEIKIQLTVSERKRESLENVLKATRRELETVKGRRAATEESLRTLEEKHNEMHVMHENTKKQHGTFPVKIAHLQSTVKSLEEDVKRLSKEKENISFNLDNTKTELGQAQSELRRNQRDKNHLEKELIRLQQHNSRQDDNEKRLQITIETLRQSLIQQHTEFDKIKVELDAVKRHDEETNNRMKAQNERVMSTEGSLQNVRKQFEEHQEKTMQLRQKYVNEKIALENIVLKLKNEIQDAMNDMREKEVLHRKQLKTVQEEYREKESRMDGQYVNLQNEYTALNKLLESVQNDKALKMKDFETEREAFREKLNEITQLRQLEADSFHESESQYKIQRARLGDDIQRMEEDMQAVLSSHVHEMTALASENAKMRQEAEIAKDEVTNLKSRIDDFKKKLYQFQDDIVRPMKNYAASVSKAIERVQDTKNQLRTKLEDTKDQLATSMLQRDDEHGQLIMAQDNIGRLKHQIANLNSRLESEIGQAEERVRKLNAETIANNKLRSDMEIRLHSKMEEVELATKNNTKLQLDRQLFQEKLSALQSEYTRNVNQERENFEALHIKQRQQSNELQDLHHDHEILTRNYNNARNRIEILLGEKSSMQDTITKLHSQKKVAEGKYLRNTQVLKTDLMKLEAQMQRTVGMYNQIKLHRDRLKDDNLNLRHEMEGIHNNVSNNAPKANKNTSSMLANRGREAGGKVEKGSTNPI
jgi:chromosome segregation ATPase